MKAKILLFVLILVLLLGLTACDGGSRGKKRTATSEPAAEMANPASVYCEEQGGTLEIRTGQDGGQFGVCVFDDGSECEEWAFFRGECQPGE